MLKFVCLAIIKLSLSDCVNYQCGISRRNSFAQPISSAGPSKNKPKSTLCLPAKHSYCFSTICPGKVNSKTKGEESCCLHFSKRKTNFLAQFICCLTWQYIHSDNKIRLVVASAWRLEEELLINRR